MSKQDIPRGESLVASGRTKYCSSALSKQMILAVACNDHSFKLFIDQSLKSLQTHYFHKYCNILLKFGTQNKNGEDYFKCFEVSVRKTTSEEDNMIWTTCFGNKSQTMLMNVTQLVVEKNKKQNLKPQKYEELKNTALLKLIPTIIKQNKGQVMKITNFKPQNNSPHTSKRIKKNEQESPCFYKVC